MKTIYIDHYNPITAKNTNSFMAFVNTVVEKESPDEIYFLFASGGGSVDAGIVLYNYLKSLKDVVTITMHNIGAIDSIANTVFMGAKNRYAVTTASFLFHGVTWTFPSNGQHLSQIKEVAGQISEMENKISKVISDHTDLTDEDLKKLFKEGETMGSDTALQKKVVSEIRDIAIPKGSIHVAMNFNENN
jgi:ATP-dependent Clp protease protease subunit